MYHKIYPFKSMRFIGFYIYKVVEPSSPFNPRTFLWHHKETPYLLASDKHRSAFYLYGFAYTEYFIQMEAYNLWPFLSGFFH